METRENTTSRGEWVTLRPATQAAALRLLQIFSEPAVAEWWGRWDLERVRREMIDPGDGTVVFVVVVDGETIGLIQCAAENEPDYRHASIEIALHPGWHGRGLGGDPIRTLARHLFHAPVAITGSPSTRPPTITARSGPMSGLASGPSASCASTSAAPTAAGTADC